MDSSKILSKLKKAYPDSKIALDYTNSLELLVATILSAQCTDKRVNIVTKNLFKKYKKIEDFAKAKQEVFEQEIRSTGFYRNKAKNIIASARIILKDFDGKVPDTMEALLSLPGVARKTANILLTDGFGKVEGIAVDTHVKRLSNRIGFSKEDNPDKIEQDLMRVFNKKDWKDINHLLIQHGREICDAKKPKCAECVIRDCCEFFSLSQQKLR